MEIIRYFTLGESAYKDEFKASEAPGNPPRIEELNEHFTWDATPAIHLVQDHIEVPEFAPEFEEAKGLLEEKKTLEFTPSASPGLEISFKSEPEPKSSVVSMFGFGGRQSGVILGADPTVKNVVYMGNTSPRISAYLMGPL